MEPATNPSAIVTLALACAQAVESWAVGHRTATLAAHEQALLRIGRRYLGRLLGAALERAQHLDQPAVRRLSSACPNCGRRRRPHQWRTRRPLTVCGPAPYQRPEFRCGPCRQRWVPADAVLGLGHHQVLSDGVQVWAAETGAQLPFRQAATQLERLAGIGLGAETIRTHTEQVGTDLVATRQAAADAIQAGAEPMTDPAVLATDLLVIEADGVMVRYTDGWHEAKVGEVAGCQLGNGRPRTDPAHVPHHLVAPSYVATRAPASAFGSVLLAEAARRGALDVVGWEQPSNVDPRLAGVTGPSLALLRPVVVLGDGAHWIWNLAAEHFGDARTEIVDYFHATEHVWAVAQALFGDGTPATTAWADQWCDDLLEHGPAGLQAAWAAVEPMTETAAERLRVERGYFQTHADRMAYPTFRARGLPIGSGAVESAAKHVVQTRMKRAGMRWREPGGEALLALCAQQASGRPFPPVSTRLRAAA